MLICVLAFALYGQGDRPVYRTLGAAPVPAAVETIIVVFEPGARERDVRQTLLDVHATASGGPSPEGAYILSVAAADATTALAQLRRTASVRFAQPGPEPIGGAR